MPRLANGYEEFYARDGYTQNGDYYLDYFIGKDRFPTMDYPHVHIRDIPGKQITLVIASRIRGNHPFRKQLHNADGNELNEVIDEAMSYL